MGFLCISYSFAHFFKRESKRVELDLGRGEDLEKLEEGRMIRIHV